MKAGLLLGQEISCARRRRPRMADSTPARRSIAIFCVRKYNLVRSAVGDQAAGTVVAVRRRPTRGARSGRGAPGLYTVHLVMPRIEGLQHPLFIIGPRPSDV